MKLHLLFLSAFLILIAPASRGQNGLQLTASTSSRESRSPAFFPHNWIRGFVDAGFAPSHNEPDLGRCAFPQPAGSGGVNSPCTAYARYLMTGYLEIQPINRSIARHLFFFFEPKVSFGNNIPQLSYTASAEPIAFDRSIGAGIELPHNFELRVTQHQVRYLGRYKGNLGPADLHTSGPYGLYTTVSVRWYFGGFDRAKSGY
ncbi:MAG: hypothetical protein PVS2B2_13050 [Candidatus Acidiferrum sp.]